MINGNVQEFISGLHYGDQRFFKYNGVSYFIEGYVENDYKEMQLVSFPKKLMILTYLFTIELKITIIP